MTNSFRHFQRLSESVNYKQRAALASFKNSPLNNPILKNLYHDMSNGDSPDRTDRSNANAHQQIITQFKKIYQPIEGYRNVCGKQRGIMTSQKLLDSGFERLK